MHSRWWTLRFSYALDLATMAVVQHCLRLQLAKLNVQTTQLFRLQAVVACAVLSHAAHYCCRQQSDQLLFTETELHTLVSVIQRVYWTLHGIHLGLQPSRLVSVVTRSGQSRMFL